MFECPLVSVLCAEGFCVGVTESSFLPGDLGIRLIRSDICHMLKRLSGRTESHLLHFAIVSVAAQICV